MTSILKKMPKTSFPELSKDTSPVSVIIKIRLKTGYALQKPQIPPNAPATWDTNLLSVWWILRSREDYSCLNLISLVWTAPQPPWNGSSSMWMTLKNTLTAYGIYALIDFLISDLLLTIRHQLELKPHKPHKKVDLQHLHQCFPAFLGDCPDMISMAVIRNASLQFAQSLFIIRNKQKNPSLTMLLHALTEGFFSWHAP